MVHQLAVAGGYVALITDEKDLFVFTGNGKLLAVEKRLGGMLSLAAHTDALDRPIFVVASDTGLTGYTVGDGTRSAAGASRE